MASVSIGTEEYIVEHVVGLVRDGDPNRLARCLAEHAGQESVSSSIPPNPSGREDKLLVSGVASTALSLEACGRRVDDRAQAGIRHELWSYQERGDPVVILGGVLCWDYSADIGSFTSKARRAPFHGSGSFTGLPSTEAIIMPASIVSRIRVFPEVLRDLTRPSRDRTGRGLPE